MAGEDVPGPPSRPQVRPPVFDGQSIVNAVTMLARSEEVRARHEADVQKAEIEADKEVRLASLKTAEKHIERNATVDAQKAKLAWGAIGAVTLVVVMSFVYAMVTGDSQVVIIVFVAGISALGGYGAGVKKGRESRPARPHEDDEDDEDE